jgi:hypothetical protein
MRSISAFVLGAVAILSQQTVADHGCSKTSDGWGSLRKDDLGNQINALRNTPDNVFTVPNRGIFSMDVPSFQVRA